MVVEDDMYFHINMYTLLQGTHALLIKNKNAGRICKCLSNMTTAIDGKYAKSIAQGELNGFYIYPTLCTQSTEFTSSTCTIM